MEMKKKSLGKEILVVLAETAMLVSLVILFVCPVSCKVTELGIQLVPANYESPVIEEFSVKSEKNLEMVFSHSVKLASLSVSPKNVVKVIKYDNPDSGEKCFVRIEFSDGLVVGEKYSISGTATDEFGNSLTFSRPFTGFNANVAKLELVEIHPKYSGETKGNGVFKNEYVLCKVKKSGNLSGLRILSATDGEEKAYDFPALEVSEGNLIAVHFRNKGSGCVDELEDKINLSSAFYSKDNVRDLWVKNEGARLGDKTDVIVIENTADGTLVDGAIYASSELETWGNENIEKLALRVSEQGLWKGGSSVKSAFRSDGISAAKSFVKIEAENSSSSWNVGTPTLK